MEYLAVSACIFDIGRINVFWRWCFRSASVSFLVLSLTTNSALSMLNDLAIVFFS